MPTPAEATYQLNAYPPDPMERLYQRRLGRVKGEISPDDSMFEGDREHYFSVGRSAFRCIRHAMLLSGVERFRSILDFGCGYGRVLRVLKAAFPGARLAACDIAPQAADYCAQAFGAEAVYSSENPEAIKIAGSFDLIWCGTLLTNIQESHFVQLLELFGRLMAPGGLLVFTTHGPFVTGRIRSGEFQYGLDPAQVPAILGDYDTKGFGYLDYPMEVRDRLGLSRYGISISTPQWVSRQVERLPHARMVSYLERAWDNHQDSVAVIRDRQGG